MAGDALHGEEPGVAEAGTQRFGRSVAEASKAASHTLQEAEFADSRQIVN